MCDSVLATARQTRGGRPIFGKNSDRPADEAQPLVSVPAATHTAGTTVRCQYIEIEQAPRTHAFVGSRPAWLWGVEHGVNEHGVAVGNHTVYTKDPVADVGLLGMDLVRLALERATSAREAVDVIAELIEKHGQGGSGFAEITWPYHNSFLAADADDAYLLEASAKHWALKRLGGGGNASNHVSIGNDWDALSADCIEHARSEGWSSGDGARFDFAAAYRDAATIPPVVSSGRHRANCEALARANLDVPALKRMLRDHYEGGDVHVPGRMPDDERFFSVCMHSGAVGVTAASMVVELAPPPGRPLLAWVTFCNPCIAPYLPVFPEAALPEDFTRGGREAASGGAWWRFKRLLGAVESDFGRHGRRVRDAWKGFERELEAETDRCLTEAAGHDGPARRAILTRFMADVWTETSLRLDALLRETEAVR